MKNKPDRRLACAVRNDRHACALAIVAQLVVRDQVRAGRSIQMVARKRDRPLQFAAADHGVHQHREAAAPAVVGTLPSANILRCEKR